MLVGPLFYYFFLSLIQWFILLVYWKFHDVLQQGADASLPRSFLWPRENLPANTSLYRHQPVHRIITWFTPVLREFAHSPLYLPAAAAAAAAASAGRRSLELQNQIRKELLHQPPWLLRAKVSGEWQKRKKRKQIKLDKTRVFGTCNARRKKTHTVHIPFMITEKL